MEININWSELILFGLLCYPVLNAIYVSFGIFLYHSLFDDKIVNFYKLQKNSQPMISIIVPAHNEQKTLYNTVQYLVNKINYSNYEILIVDDGSNDNTFKIATEAQETFSIVRTIRILKNEGKAHALNVGIGFAKGEFILSNDADTVPERNALQKYMNYFDNNKNKNVGAVTANIDIQNKEPIITKSQVIEFTGIVGGIKRTQAATADSMYALSGANTMYRKIALIDVGGFRKNRATEDISISWDLNYYQWQTKFAPNIFFYVLAPDNFKDLYRQRKRWSQGGTEVWLANLKRIIFHPVTLHKQLSIYIDNTLSFFWSISYFFSIFIMIITNVYYLWNKMFNDLYLFWIINMMIICFEYLIGAIQLTIALHYDQKGLKMKYFWFAPVYISMLWIINPITIIVTLKSAFLTIIGRENSGTWKSPKR